MNFDFQDLITNLSDGLYIIDKSGKIAFWNKAAEDITGFTADEVLGSTCSDNILIHVDEHGNNLCAGHCPLVATIKDNVSRSAHVFLHHKNGHRVPVHVKVARLHDEKGEVVGGAELFTDNSEIRLKESKIKELEGLAFLDPLTKIVNRNFINIEIQNKISEMKRYGNRFGILFIDIDHFKIFNDTYGHGIGDHVLETVSSTLKNNIRALDFIGRWGGEEFVGIINNANEDVLSTMGERIRALIEKTNVYYNEKALHVTASVGGALSQTGDTIKSVVGRADEQMYKAKIHGRNKFMMLKTK